jgi:NAD(P)H-hydrate repair Nnr-like enzyme with NAD(P)H-hydrate dehydratase domain
MAPFILAERFFLGSDAKAARGSQNTEAAAVLGVLVHGRAGALARAEKGFFTSADLLEYVSRTAAG